MTPTIRAFCCALALSLAGVLALTAAASAQAESTLPGTVTPWLGMAALIISLAGSVYAWLTSRSAANTERLDKLESRIREQQEKLQRVGDNVARLNDIEQRLTHHSERLQNVENDMQHIPDRESQHRVELALAEMNGRFSTLEEKLKPIASTSQRLGEFLLEQAKTK